MKIIYITSSLSGGGAEFPIPYIFRLFESLGHEVHLISCARGDMQTAALLDSQGIAYKIMQGKDEGRIQALHRLFQTIKSMRPDLIWTSLPRSTMEGQIVGKILGIPVLSWQHSAYIRPYKRKIMQFLQKLSHFWVSDSQDVAFFLQKQMKVESQRILKWPIFSLKKNWPSASPYKDGFFKIGILGRLDPVKGHLTLFRAIRRIKIHFPEVARKIRIMIGGNGDEEASLKAIAKAKDIDSMLDWFGFVKDAPAFLSNLHAYVQPSLYEGFCIAAHEAMATGLPVIATNVGEMKHSIVDGKNGFLIMPHDEKALAAYIVYLANNPDKAAAFGKEGQNYVQKQFSEDNFNAAGKLILNKIEGEIINNRIAKIKRHPNQINFLKKIFF